MNIFRDDNQDKLQPQPPATLADNQISNIFLPRPPRP